MPKQAKPKTSDHPESGLRSSRGITSVLTFVSRLHPSAPIVRLPDGEISDDLFGNWLGIEPEPKLEVLGPRERKTCKKQARLTNRPFSEILDVGRQEPAPVVSDEGKHIFHGLSDSAAIESFKGPYGIRNRGKDLAQRTHRVQIEQAMTIRLGAGQLQGEAAVWGDLVGHQH